MRMLACMMMLCLCVNLSMDAVTGFTVNGVVHSVLGAAVAGWTYYGVRVLLFRRPL